MNLCISITIDYLNTHIAYITSTPMYDEEILQAGYLSKRDGQEVQSSGTVSPWRADPRLLVIPTSCPRVAEDNPK
ncbi:MAG: hypothetical protein EOP45_00215 [Sphingobacteriaceae bacterium]|nr:MAG: hypothetical protein EOP45_00215 [Sphingobacteriaceae bacterium]